MEHPLVELMKKHGQENWGIGQDVKGKCVCFFVEKEPTEELKKELKEHVPPDWSFEFDVAKEAT